ncbi:terminase small subunit [Bacillus testis]|uniref:terminase small subunit n=1 Tax=Bacillus testis TaxID=1622072 RepID=UPI00067E7998|nr:terminase small subunit [Bacillus testis]
MKLTEKQKRFADYYIECGNASESAVKAGYSEKTATEMGYENLRKPHLKAYIDERLKELADKRIMSAEEVLQTVTSFARNEEQEDVVVFGESGPEIVTKGISAKDRLKALELIGKRYAMWTDNKNLTGNMGVTIIDDIGEDDA